MGCVGRTKASFEKCVINVHNKKSNWLKFRESGLAFIKRTHSRQKATEQWSQIIDTGLDLVSRRRMEAKKECPEGEELYLRTNRDVADAIRGGQFSSGFQHWLKFGKDGGRDYGYCSKNHTLFTTEILFPQEQCAEGEEIYMNEYKDVAEAVRSGIFSSAFEHWREFGKGEGRMYYCGENTKHLPYKEF